MYAVPKSIICLLLFLLVQTGGSLMAQNTAKGIVRDSVSLEGLPFASVRIKDTNTSAVADSKGFFEIRVPVGATEIIASCQGYEPKSVPLRKSSIQLYDINLSPVSQELAEIVVKKKKYSKKNNPAVEFARRIRNSADQSDPKNNDYYSFDKYERISIGINDFDTTASQNRMLKKMPYLSEHVDTSEIDGKPVLNVSVKERSSSYAYRKSPHSEKNIIHGVKSNGLDEFMEQDNVQTILDDLLRDVELYANDIPLLRNTFVSPLSSLSPDFYRFYLVDSTAVLDDSDQKHIVLAFYPRNKASFGFKGHLYVPANDTTMFVRRVDMEVDDDINLNYVKALKIRQDFKKAPNGSRQKLSDNMFAVMQVIPGTPQLYISRKINFNEHSFEKPDSAKAIFSRIGNIYIEPEAYSRDSLFWQNARMTDMQKGESRVELLMQRLRRNKLFYWGEQIIKVLERGYIPTGKESRFDIGPVNTLASYNTLEGLRLRLGGFTTANLNPHLFASGYVAYGFRDRKWKYKVEGEYSFPTKKYHPGEFPIHSFRIGHKYDIDRLGTHYLYTNADNFVLSLARMPDDRFTYRRETEGAYTLELANNFSLVAKVSHIREEASPFVRFVNGFGAEFTHYNETVLGLTLRYAPGEKFFQMRSMRVPVNRDALVLELTHQWAPTNLGSTFCINRTELSVSKDLSLSILGKLRTSFSGGHVWAAAPFPELFIPNANLSYTIQPGSFALMNPMEFINSTYASWHISWHLRGALFNLIPGFRNLRLREIVSFSGLYGKLSDRNNPTFNKDLYAFPADAAVSKMNKPYMEISAGLDNIFTILRVDYVWRLNYCDVPYKIDRSGVRIAMHFTF